MCWPFMPVVISYHTFLGASTTLFVWFGLYIISSALAHEEPEELLIEPTIITIVGSFDNWKALCTIPTD